MEVGESAGSTTFNDVDSAQDAISSFNGSVFGSMGHVAPPPPPTAEEKDKLEKKEAREKNKAARDKEKERKDKERKKLEGKLLKGETEVRKGGRAGEASCMKHCSLIGSLRSSTDPISSFPPPPTGCQACQALQGVGENRSLFPHACTIAFLHLASLAAENPQARLRRPCI